jgi:hypothetical protein
MDMNLRFACVAVLALLIVPAVGGGVALAQDVTYNYLPGTDFSKYKTYKWVAIEGAERPDQLVNVQIMQAIDTVLAGKGLAKATGEAADLFIAYQVAVNQEQQWNTYGTGGYRWGGGMATTTSSTIHVGTIALDMYDSMAKQLVWKGQASKTLSGEKDPAKRQKNLDKAIAKLLKDFPPKPKK